MGEANVLVDKQNSQVIEQVCTDCLQYKTLERDFTNTF